MDRPISSSESIISAKNIQSFSLRTAYLTMVLQVIVTTQLLSLLLRSLRQPRVISEVLSGMILGPSILGRIPGFSKTIFPPDSLPFLNLTANIGLVLFLFLVGLEVDVRLIKRNARYSGLVAAAGMILPFGLGTAVASAVYDKFVDKNEVSFSHFLLFVGVAFA
jgi:Kef-type K+ transport system membrane component KefB